MGEQTVIGNAAGDAQVPPPPAALAAVLAVLAGTLLAAVPGLAGAGSAPASLLAAVAGWSMLALGAVALGRPTRPVLSLAAAAGVGVAGWRLMLLAGGAGAGAVPDLPFGPLVGVAQGALGIVAAVVAGLLLRRGDRPARLPVAVVAVAGAVALAGATAVLALPAGPGDVHDLAGAPPGGRGHGGGVGEQAAAVADHGAGGHNHGGAGGHSHEGDDHSGGHPGHGDLADHSGHSHGDGHHGSTSGHSASGHEHASMASHDHGSGHGHHPGDPGHGHPGVDPNAVRIDYGPANRCDIGFNPASYYRDATIAGVDFINGPTPEEINAPHSMSEVEAARLVQRLADGSDAAYFEWLRGGHDHGGHGGASGGKDPHLGPQAWKAITDPAACAQLSAQLQTARAVALSYPTARDAERAGYKRTTPYVIGIAAHYVNDSLIDATFDVSRPEMLLYDGNGPDARIVGVSYEIYHEADTEPSVGFVGRNDRYHRHETLCMKDGVTIGDSSMTKERCEALGGKIFDGRYYWMSHAWVVPGCESPWGVFSQVNPLLDLQLGNASGTTSGCAASSVRHRFNLAPGVRTEAARSALPDVTLPSLVGFAALTRRRRWSSVGSIRSINVLRSSTSR